MITQKLSWSELDLHNPTDLDDLHSLLRDHYVSDTTDTFRLAYSKDFLKFALLSPGYKSAWHLGIRLQTGSAQSPLIAFISAIPICLVVNQNATATVEINFLCIHHKFRNIKLAPLLINEITRRVELDGINQAVYTISISTQIPVFVPVATATYYHRFLNPKKLAEVGFVTLNKKLTLTKLLKQNKLPASRFNLLLLNKNDCVTASELLHTYSSKFNLRMQFSQTEFEHWFYSKPDIVETYVIRNSEIVTDFVSVYFLPTTVINNPKHQVINVAYVWAVVANSMKPSQLVSDMLIILSNKGIDLCNCLNTHDNQSFITDLNFVPGNGGLNFYLRDKPEAMTLNEIGLTMF